MPVPATRTEPLRVKYQMYAQPAFTALIKGQQVEFKTLAEARERASKEGYKGIKVN